MVPYLDFPSNITTDKLLSKAIKLLSKKMMGFVVLHLLILNIRLHCLFLSFFTYDKVLI